MAGAVSRALRRIVGGQLRRDTADRGQHHNHRLGDQRAKRLLFTGDGITGAQAAEWGLAVEAPEPADLDERTERLVARIAALPVNQLIMVKLALNSALLQQGVATSRMVS
ncbi:hypothetical protein JQ473_16290, partial [Brucella melitensis]|nr:hypothetical protein [Brucella melitensis]